MIGKCQVCKFVQKTKIDVLIINHKSFKPKNDLCKEKRIKHEYSAWPRSHT